MLWGGGGAAVIDSNSPRVCLRFADYPRTVAEVLRVDSSAVGWETLAVENQCPA